MDGLPLKLRRLGALFFVVAFAPLALLADAAHATDDQMTSGLLDGMTEEAISGPATREGWEKATAIGFHESFRSSREESRSALEEGGGEGFRGARQLQNGEDCSSDEPCNAGYLCNFDYQDSGTCEACRFASTAYDCRNDGLPDAGVESCLANCIGSKKGGHLEIAVREYPLTVTKPSSCDDPTTCSTSTVTVVLANTGIADVEWAFKPHEVTTHSKPYKWQSPAITADPKNGTLTPCNVSIITVRCIIIFTIPRAPCPHAIVMAPILFAWTLCSSQ